MTPEGIVVTAVKEYFSRPKFQKKFSIKEEYPIQMGADRRKADVVLVDSKGNLTAIAECKREGVKGNGIDQLKSYLSASDTTWGMFANSEDDNEWQFYENLGKNEFREEIPRYEFEKSVVKSGTNFLTRVSDFFTQFLQPKVKPDESKKIKIDDRVRTEMEIGRESVDPTQAAELPKPNLNHIIKDRSLQNEHRENTVEPSLNGKPYYSEDNGFSCAAALRGVPEGLPDHIGIIIRNEQLEIASNREQLQSEINQLDEEKKKLELQKHDQEQQARSITQKLANKKIKQSGLKAELEGPTNAELNQLPEVVNFTELEIQANAELNGLSEIAESPENSAETQLKERISELEQEIREKTQEHTDKRKELVSLRVKLEAPTKAELDMIDDEGPIKQKFSWRQCFTASIATIFLVPLTIYLFIFYASVVDKAFFLDVASLKGKSQDALNAIDIVNPTALSEAFQKPGNLVVILFPSIFLAFAIVAHYFWEQRKWILLGAILLFTLVFDGILAIQISQKIHEVKKIAGLITESENWMFSINDLNMWTVIFCGFIVSLLVSVLYHAAVELWKGVRPPTDESKQLETKMRAEQNPYQVQLATLKTEVKKLQKDIDQLNSEHAICTQNFRELSNQHREAQIKTEKHPIKTQIAVLKTEMQNLQNKIDSLTENIKNTQQEILEYQTEIKALSERQRTIVIDLKKMDSQVSQFVNGWCKYIAQSEIDLAEVSEKIESTKQIKEETLESYFKHLRSYSSREQEKFPIEDEL